MGCAEKPSPPTVEACGGRRLKAEVTEALEACVEGLNQVARGAGMPAVPAGTCALLFSQAACRSAWLDPRSNAEARAAACAKAYCGELDEPRPKACAEPPAVDEDARYRLYVSILRCEFPDGPVGFDPGALARTFIASDRFTMKVVLPDAAPSAPEANAVFVTVTIAALVVGGRDFADAAGLVASLGPPDGRQVIIEAESDVPHGRVVALMEELKKAGFKRLAIQTRAKQ